MIGTESIKKLLYDKIYIDGIKLTHQGTRFFFCIHFNLQLSVGSSFHKSNVRGFIFFFEMWLAFHLNHDKMKCKILCSEVKCYIFAFYMNCPLCLKLLFPQYHKFVFADLVISILGFKIPSATFHLW